MEQLDGVKKIADLYSANGTLPVYEITYAEKRIAFFLSRVGAPACAAGLEEIHANTRSVRILEQCLKQYGLPYVIGKTWTTDAIYRETRRVLEARKRQGCLAVEMECAAAYAVAQFRKIPILQFLYAQTA